MKASTRLTVSAISQQRGLDPRTTLMPSHHTRACTLSWGKQREAIKGLAASVFLRGGEDLEAVHAVGVVEPLELRQQEKNGRSAVHLAESLQGPRRRRKCAGGDGRGRELLVLAEEVLLSHCPPPHHQLRPDSALAGGYPPHASAAGWGLLPMHHWR